MRTATVVFTLRRTNQKKKQGTSYFVSAPLEEREIWVGYTFLSVYSLQVSKNDTLK
jgi:hypothetical protein